MEEEKITTFLKGRKCSTAVQNAIHSSCQTPKFTKSSLEIIFTTPLQRSTFGPNRGHIFATRKCGRNDTKMSQIGGKKAEQKNSNDIN